MRMAERRRAVLGEDHVDTLTSQDDLASLYELQGRYAEAEPLMLRALEKQQPLTLDASSVERLSTACIQLLIACGSAFKAAGHALEIDGPTEMFSEAFADLGLQQELQQWMNEAS